MTFFKNSSMPLKIIMSFLVISNACNALPEEARQKGFVYLHEIDPTIEKSLRYLTNENFVGKPLDGYENDVVILTKPTAEALKKVQEEVKKDGYELVIYDAYRPQRTVDQFMEWSKNSDQTKKEDYYPHVDKSKVFELGYVAEKSGHTRGSTVDLTLKKLNKKLYPIKKSKRILRDGTVITVLDDGTEDMGSSFDYFGEASHIKNNLIEEEYKKLRLYLNAVMKKYGFKEYAEEWWHFTLQNEPHPASDESSYFNFPVK